MEEKPKRRKLGVEARATTKPLSTQLLLRSTRWSSNHSSNPRGLDFIATAGVEEATGDVTEAKPNHNKNNNDISHYSYKAPGDHHLAHLETHFTSTQPHIQSTQVSQRETTLPESVKNLKDHVIPHSNVINVKSVIPHVIPQSNVINVKSVIPLVIPHLSVIKEPNVIPHVFPQLSVCTQEKKVTNVVIKDFFLFLMFLLSLYKHEYNVTKQNMYKKHEYNVTKQNTYTQKKVQC